MVELVSEHERERGERIEGHGAGYNSDGKAISSAVRRLLPHEGKKIIIVLSDGQPATIGYMPPDRNDTKTLSEFDLKEEVEKAIKDGVVFLGVGIHSHSVYSYYPRENTTVINDAKDIYSAIAQLLAKNIRRRE